MPSLKTSLSKFKSLPLLLLGAAVLLAGCLAVDESKLLFDFPLAKDFSPVMEKMPDFAPTRVLVLPVTGNVDAVTRKNFEGELLNALRQASYWTIIDYGQIGSDQLEVTRFNAYARARQVNAGAVLFVNLADQEFYAPLRLSASVIMERVLTQQSALSGKFDFDTRNRAVADSARRYYQKFVPNEGTADRSDYILNHTEPFVKFAGYYSGKLIAAPYAPAPPPDDGKPVKDAKPAATQ